MLPKYPRGVLGEYEGGSDWTSILPIVIRQCLRCIFPQADDHLGLDNLKLSMQVGAASPDPKPQGIAVLGRMAMDDIGDEKLLLLNPGLGEALLEQYPAALVERLLGFHTLTTQTLADQHNRRPYRAKAWCSLSFAFDIHAWTPRATPDFLRKIVHTLPPRITHGIGHYRDARVSRCQVAN